MNSYSASMFAFTVMIVLLGNHFLVVFGGQCSEPCVPGSEEIMKPKAHGTSENPVQKSLRWNCDWDTADRICNYNRKWAEFSGYWQTTTFLKDVQSQKENDKPVTFYDSGWKGRPLFTAPRDRSWDDFIKESKNHGWPSFRDTEVNWDHVRVLPDGETVSIDGTHLGHNLPDSKGNRYCINLVSIAGMPPGRREL
ncbi:hypothetical protein IV203_035218 [Nitzschia inconspicua]|uniref:Uncharacterized protein n=2 Tax=Nitzschia inconspicua TaxID=303405 RepID=A0A9K3PWY7_9STRA|nr:hypothetical protein IV203_035218 [Nitzschia inconspicua]